MEIEIKGQSGSSYGFKFYGDKKYLQEWSDEGFIIMVIDNIVPSWINDLRLIKPYCFLQDCFHFKNPFSKNKQVVIDV